MAKIPSEDFEKLFEKWSIMSPDYEIGIDKPIKLSEVKEVDEDENAKAKINNIWIDLSESEFKRSQFLLRQATTHLVEFSSMCRSKIDHSDRKNFDEKFPSACAFWLKSMMAREGVIAPLKPGEDVRPGLFKPKDAAGQENPIAASLLDFMLLNSNPNSYADAWAELHNCGLQYCPLKGETKEDAEVILITDDDDVTRTSCMSCFKVDDSPSSITSTFARPAPPIPDSEAVPDQAELLEERFLTQGARPKRDRPRIFRHKKLRR